MLPSFIKSWLPLFVAVTLLSGLIYVVVQQDYRQSANDPQIQISQDTISGLKDNSTPNNLTSSKVDLAKSLAPFTIIFSANKDVIESNATLHNQTPRPPDGVFDLVKQNGEDRFTWQPESGVRVAAVMLYNDGPKPGFVLVGRSLKEVEVREDMLTFMVYIGWLFTSAATLFICWFINQSSEKPRFFGLFGKNF